MLKVLSVDGVFDEAGLKEWGQVEFLHRVPPLFWRKGQRDHIELFIAPGGIRYKSGVLFAGPIFFLRFWSHFVFTIVKETLRFTVLQIIIVVSTKSKIYSFFVQIFSNRCETCWRKYLHYLMSVYNNYFLSFNESLIQQRLLA